MNSLEGLALLQLHGVLEHQDRPSDGDWADVLADFPLFAGVGKRRLRQLVRHATFAELAAGSLIVSTRDRSDSLYVILGGAAKALRVRAARELGVGDYFGESALIGGARPATVVATRALHVIRLPAPSVVQLAEQHPAFSLTLVRDFSAQLRLAGGV